MTLNWNEKIDETTRMPEWTIGDDKAHMVIFWSTLAKKYFVYIEIHHQTVFFSNEGHDTPTEAEKEAVTQWKDILEGINYLNDLMKETNT